MKGTSGENKNEAFMREKFEDFEYAIRFSIAFVVVEIFRYKVNPFFTIFCRFFDNLGTFGPPDFT